MDRGTVSITIARFLAGTVRVHNMNSGEVIWQGKAGDIARFEVDGPTNIGITWGALSKASQVAQAYKVCAEAGNYYSLKWKMGLFTWSVVLKKLA